MQRITPSDKKLNYVLSGHIEELKKSWRPVFGDTNHIRAVELFNKLAQTDSIKEQNSIMSNILFYAQK